MLGRMSLALGVAIAAGFVRPSSAADAPALRVGAATAEMRAEDSMVIGGGIGPGHVVGQEGKLLATAFVLASDAKLCFVAVDVLMMNRDYLDQAAERVAKECGMPAAHVLINCSHTHHAPSTVTVHGYERDEEFCRRTVEAIVAAAKRANALAVASEPVVAVFRRGKCDVGQNSRVLLKDGQIYWIGPRDGFVRPTGPFDPDLPVLAFRRADGSLAGAMFNHSTHCIGTRSGKRSPGFYGLAAQELTDELGGPVAYFSGAAGSTHNLDLNGNELVDKVKTDVKATLADAKPIAAVPLAAVKREFEYAIREFDEDAEENAVVRYCTTYAPQHANDIIKVFQDSRRKLRPLQATKRKTWLSAIRVGDVYFVGVPAEYFTKFGVEIKKRSPFSNTFVFGLSDDYVGYLPDREAFKLGGYQTWTGLHSFAAPGAGEAIVEATLEMLKELPK